LQRRICRQSPHVFPSGNLSSSFSLTLHSLPAQGISFSDILYLARAIESEVLATPSTAVDSRLDILLKESYVNFDNVLHQRDKLRAALLLAKEMFICNDISLPHTMTVIDEALKLTTPSAGAVPDGQVIITEVDKAADINKVLSAVACVPGVWRTCVRSLATSPIDGRGKGKEAVLDDNKLNELAEAAYWNFDARIGGIGPYKGLPQSTRDAFKDEYRKAVQFRPTPPNQAQEG